MSESAGISVLIIAGTEDDAAAVNTAMRDAGHAAHCTRNAKPGDLKTALEESPPVLLLVFGTPDSTDLRHTSETRDAVSPGIPILLVCDNVDEAIILDAMTAGANDVISLNQRERLQAVITREIRTSKLESQLSDVIGSARQYKHELNSLKQATGDAVADIQEGIIVNTNPAWLELFGFETDADLAGYPIMDFCAETDRPALKGGLVTCQKGKWQEGTLEIRGIRQDGNEFGLSINLENVEHDGDPAVRMLVPAEATEDQIPGEVVDQAVRCDQATGLYNRSFFLEQLEERLSSPPQGGIRAIAYIRPDRFSKSTDEVGLFGTESVISQLAKLITEYTQPADIYGRFGGTIFTLLLERGTMTDVEAWAEQIINAVGESVFEHDEKSTALTCSIGLCEVDKSNADTTLLLSEAERACRNGRTQGGNRIELNETSGAAKQVRQDDDIWVPKIRSALMENRLRLEHQPVGSLNSDIEGAYDTLVRMQDEDGETILPGEFIPVAERTGLSKNIDRWVLGASITFCAKKQAGLVFVRLSADSLKDDSLPEWLNTQVKQAGIKPEAICLEAPEDLAVKHLRQTQQLAEELRRLGFKFAIEHFGAADDNERTIKLIPMDLIKIDGSLMQGLHKNPKTQDEVKELVRQAKAKNLLTVAERVQDANTMAVLWQLGVDYIQGNYVQNQEIVIEDTSQTAITPMLNEAGDQPEADTAAEETPA